MAYMLDILAFEERHFDRSWPFLCAEALIAWLYAFVLLWLQAPYSENYKVRIHHPESCKEL